MLNSLPGADIDTTSTYLYRHHFLLQKSQQVETVCDKSAAFNPGEPKLG